MECLKHPATATSCRAVAAHDTLQICRPRTKESACWKESITPTCGLVLGHSNSGVPVVEGVTAHISVEVSHSGGAVGDSAVALDHALDLGLEI
jgi:hypothetical protein